MSDPQPPQKLKLVVTPEAEAGVYTNQLNLNFSRDEVHVQFGQVAPALLPGQEGVHIVRARVTMVPATFKDFVRVCNEVLRAYEAQHGVVGAASTVVFDAGKLS